MKRRKIHAEGENAELFHSKYSSLDLFEQSIQNTNVRDAYRLNFKVTRCRFNNVEFKDCDMSGDFFDNYFTDCSFINCDLFKTEFDDSVFKSCLFVGCDLNRASLYQVESHATEFRDCNLVAAYLTCFKGNDSVFSGCDFAHSNIFEADMGACTIKDSTDLVFANIKDSKMPTDMT